MRSPNSSPMGMFCRLGFEDESLPVRATVWLKLVCRRPVSGLMYFGKAST